MYFKLLNHLNHREFKTLQILINSQLLILTNREKSLLNPKGYKALHFRRNRPTPRPNLIKLFELSTGGNQGAVILGKFDDVGLKSNFRAWDVLFFIWRLVGVVEGLFVVQSVHWKTSCGVEMF